MIENISRALPFMQSHPLWNPEHPSVEELARKNFKNLGRHLVEISRLYHGQEKGVLDSIELRGRENLDRARAKGKGVVCFSGHCGNWEVMALALGSIFGDGVVVARRQKNPFLEKMITRMRMRYHSRVLDKQGALRGILKALKKGELVGILADQAVLPEEGVLIEVMGRPAWASKAPAIIARASGAAVVPVFIHREEGRQVITFHPEYSFSGDESEAGITKDIQALSRYVEDFVVAHPTQWYWVHRRWKRAFAAGAASMEKVGIAATN
uniref:Lipid A biosynthesis acyltransferase n=1 Tax=Citrifermentans bremense TaxID=60035 RepID=A0A6S6LUY1_9BACT